jgi:hypothetical protein
MQEELDQMLAPIALYPDSLLSQVLMAATYPLEVVQAARWSRANSHLNGQDAVRAVESMDWDPSVKSLVAFPQVLYRMDEQLEWTQRLGEAFLAQETHVMDTIQGLRQKAEQAGNLKSNERVRVTRQDGETLIEPAQPQVVYVPYYNPVVVYGGWWWPAYPPVYWGPPPGYYGWRGYAPGFFWGSGVAISAGFFFGHFNWPRRQVMAVQGQTTQVVVNRQVTVVQRPHLALDQKPVRWQHDPVHRRNVPYRHLNWRPPSGQPQFTRGDGRTGPNAPRESPGARPEARSATPPARPQYTAPQPRSEHNVPRVGNRLPERTVRTEGQRPQARAPDSRPAVAAPYLGPSRPAAPAPAARAEPRRYSPAPEAGAAPPREAPLAYRAESRAPARDHFVVPQAAPIAPMQAPTFSVNHAGGAARAYGGGRAPAMSAGRGGGRS